uniref:Uncharacterized protein n=1 Tax=Ralstonia solanacearum TaxID=305 RepID=A0A0S4TPM1_RALSL|nr:protein of unknown function [Ralstonia solanacearum]
MHRFWPGVRPQTVLDDIEAAQRRQNHFDSAFKCCLGSAVHAGETIRRANYAHLPIATQPRNGICCAFGSQVVTGSLPACVASQCCRTRLPPSVSGSACHTPADGR